MSMRLLRVDIDEFRSIENQWLPADGLVVLFGPNSAGKTTVLEAVEHVFTQAGKLRTDPGVPDELTVMGSVTFDLPGADVADSPDGRIYRSLLCGEYIKVRSGSSDEDEPWTSDDPWAWLCDEITGKLKEAPVDQARSLLAEALAKKGSSGAREERELLARSLFDPEVVYFTADLLDIHLQAHQAGTAPGLLRRVHYH